MRISLNHQKSLLQAPNICWVPGQRLQLTEKLPRTIELFDRFFKLPPGQSLLRAWRGLCEGNANTAEDEAAPAWYPFRIVWELASCEALRKNGDARLKLIELMETHFRLKTETYGDLTKFPSDNFLARERIIGSMSSQATKFIGSMNHDPKTYQLLFEKIILPARLPLLVFHHLFADDSLVYYRSLDYILKAIENFPEDYGLYISSYGQAAAQIQRPEFEALGDWMGPSDSEVYVTFHRWLFTAVEVIYDISTTTPWCLAGADSLMDRLLTQWLDRFDESQKSKIKTWRAKLSTQVLSSRSTLSQDNVHLPGVADRPIVDTRVEEVVAQDGSSSWANRHLYCP